MDHYIYNNNYFQENKDNSQWSQNNENLKKNIYFHCQRHLAYGLNMFVTGNIPELANWTAQKSIKMQWSEGDHWRCSIPIRQDFEGELEYKFLVADDFMKNVIWDQGFNQKLSIVGCNTDSIHDLDLLQQNGRSGSGNVHEILIDNSYNNNEDLLKISNKNQQKNNFQPENHVKAISFNISSKLDSTWQKRSKLILKLIQKENPDFLGLQEVLPYQREFLKGNLNNYLYFGKSRSEEFNDEENGILYRKDKYFKLEGGHIWFSKEEGKAENGTLYPRMLTWCILQDLQHQDRRIGVINTHFDDLSEESRKIASETIQNLHSKFTSSCELVVITGCFNEQEEEQNISQIILNHNNEVYLKSARQEYNPVEKEHQIGKNDDLIQKKHNTYHAFQGEKCEKSIAKQFDHIFFQYNELQKQQYEVYSFRVLNDIRKQKRQNSQIIDIYPSNHHPVVAEFIKLEKIEQQQKKQPKIQQLQQQQQIQEVKQQQQQSFKIQSCLKKNDFYDQQYIENSTQENLSCSNKSSSDDSDNSISSNSLKKFKKSKKRVTFKENIVADIVYTENNNIQEQQQQEEQEDDDDHNQYHNVYEQFKNLFNNQHNMLVN